MRLLLPILSAILVAFPASAQYDASLVADIRPGAEGSYPLSFAVYEDRLFFSAIDDQKGRELWAYNSALDQVEFIADINPGSDGSWPSYTTDHSDCLIVYEGRLFFQATDGESGLELWSFDNSTGEATLTADIIPGPDSSEPSNFVIYDNRLFFTARDAQHGEELWAFDATTDEAELVIDIRPGSFGSHPDHVTTYDGRLFFAASDEQNDRELWAYDASTDEANLVADIWPGLVKDTPIPNSSYPSDLTTYNGRLFFQAEDGESGPELWVYDAGLDQAELVADIRPGGVGSEPYFITAHDESLFFAANNGPSGREVWTYDAHTGEHTLIADVAPSSEDSHPRTLITFGDHLFFQANDGEHGEELWTYAPDTGESTLTLDINPGPSGSAAFWSSLINYADRLFFAANDGHHGLELWAITPTNVANEPGAAPQPALLQAPHPNPAHSTTTVSFEVAEAGPVRIEVLDVLGRRVEVLTDEVVAAGEHTARWEAGALPSGLYLIRLMAGDQVQTQRLTLTR